MTGPVRWIPQGWLLGAVLSMLAGCATLPPNENRVPVYAIPAVASDELTRIAQASVPEGDAFRPLPTSVFSMDARLTLVRRAHTSLDLQYYLIQNDVTGRTLLRAVRDAALRGVRVRVLVDDLYTSTSDRLLQGLAAYPNVQVRLFNPFPAGRSSLATRFLFSAFDFSRINHRMHNKMFIADGVFAVAGGRNIADEYFFHSSEGNFLDFDLLLAGSSVPALEQIFDEYWNSRWVYSLETIMPATGDRQARQDDFETLTAGEAHPPAVSPDEVDPFSDMHALSADIDHPPVTPLTGKVRVFADNPEKASGRSQSGTDPTTVTAQTLEAFSTARSSLLLVSPYFVPNEQAMVSIEEARRAGIKIDVVTNSMAATDEPLTTAAYAVYRKRLLRAGVNLYEISSHELKFVQRFRSILGSSTGRSHAKLAVIDNKVVFVGSMNLDMRSSRLNTELGILVTSQPFAEGVTKVIGFVEDSGCYRVRLIQPGDGIQWVGDQGGANDVFDGDPEVTLGTQLQIFLLGPFVSTSEL